MENFDSGSLKPLDLATINSETEESWAKWKNAFEIYLQINHITDPIVKKLHLLHKGGMGLQDVFNNLPPSKEQISEGRDVYKITIRQLDKFFSAKKILIVERSKFRAIEQGNLTIDEFVLKLRKQARIANLTGTTLENYMIDQIASKCKSTELKKKLFEKDLSLERVINIAKSLEAAQNQAKTYINEAPMSINKIETHKAIRCFRCGKEGHISSSKTCPGLKEKCAICNAMGHFTRCCRTKVVKRKSASNGNVPNKKYKNTQYVRLVEKPEEKKSANEVDESDEEDALNINALKTDKYIFAMNGDRNKNNDKTIIPIKIGGVNIDITVDSASDCNAIDEETWKILKAHEVEIFNQKEGGGESIKGYASDNPMSIIGTFDADIETNRSKLFTHFYVIRNAKKPLLGKETAFKLGVLKIGLDLNVNQVEGFKHFPKIKNLQIEIPINKNVKPVCQPYRRPAIPLQKLIEDKLEELEQLDIIEKVHGPSMWVSPIVPILKNEKEIRLCIDMRQANKAVMRENHPLPTLDEILPQLKGSKYFARLDLVNAFHQIELHPKSRHITTFITSKGLYRYKRLMFGISCAPEIYQKILEQVLSKCTGAFNYIDDIIIFAPTEELLEKRLNAVLQALENQNMTLNKKKCIFKSTQLEFLGVLLTSQGLKPAPNKVEAIKNFRAPVNASELRSFLGLVNYNGKFIGHIATLTEPLRNLLREQKFKWNKEHQQCFDEIKTKLSDQSILGYYDPADKTRVIADASPVGLGAILIQFKNKTPRIVYYASKSLSAVERRYSQCEKEALALVWAVERFAVFLYGKKFQLVKDHKPLQVIFKPESKPCPRIQRWVLRLQSFTFDVIYCQGKHNIADPLSRLCCNNDSEGVSFDPAVEKHIFYITAHAAPVAITLQEIQIESRKDPEFQLIKKGINENQWENAAVKYRAFQTEFCFVDDLLLRNNKIVIPKELQFRTLELGHEGHPGMARMKQRLRTKVWWFRMDSMVEDFVKKCRGCLLVSTPAAPVPMARKELPTNAWETLAIDFLGPLPSGHNLLVVIDYYSRFQKIFPMKTITSSAVIEKLKESFADFGVPRLIIADNGKSFVSEEFKTFCKTYGIQLSNTIPYWPSMNGEVERQNRSILKRLIISQNTNGNWKLDLMDFLLMYHATPHPATSKPPLELMCNRPPRDKLPMIPVQHFNDTEIRDIDKVFKQKGKEYADKKRRAKETEIQIGDEVLVKNFHKDNKLSPNFNPEPHRVEKIKGGDCIVIGENSGVKRRRYVGHLKKIEPITTSEPEINESVNNTIPVTSCPKRLRTMPAKFKEFEMNHLEMASLPNSKQKEEL